MSTFPEQFSAAGKSQVEAQLAFFQNVTAKAVEGAEKIINLNLTTTRASFEKSSAAMQQLFTVKDPRDLFSLTTQSQANFDTLLAYGRELFSIASGTQLALLQRNDVPVQENTVVPSAPAEPFPVAAKVKPIALAAAEVVESTPPEPVAADVAELEVELGGEQADLLVIKPKRKK
ncbi:phasin family protein [Massilia sp. CF038]|uniref:phasin family protein n=1 Tax=Massilia sp. CF038 TaxID=1881045 RepID=UPI00091563A5|nr:phasin family protein [Massilia sp. CF038]SHG41176.1 phasin family protein [Massilia sp. CF038]